MESKCVNLDVLNVIACSHPSPHKWDIYQISQNEEEEHMGHISGDLSQCYLHIVTVSERSEII